MFLLQLDVQYELMAYCSIFFTAVAGSGAFVTQRVATADNPAIPTFSEACSLSSSTQVPTILFKRKSLVPGLGLSLIHI